MTNHRLFGLLNGLAYLCLLLTVLAVPLFLDENLVNFYIIPKQYVLIGLILGSFIAFAVKTVLSKRLHYRHSILDLPILLILLVALLSAIFSANSYTSFLGRNEYFVPSLLVLVFLAGFYWLLVNYLDTPKRWRVMMDAFVLVGGLTALLFVLKMVFKIDLLAGWLAPVWNTIDKLNSLFGLWLVIVFIVAAGQIIRKNLPVGRSLLYFFITVLCLSSLVLLSFKVLWWLLLGGLVLLLLLGVSFIREARLGWLSVLFAFLILSIIFITFGTPPSLQSAVPAEVSLGLRPSWSVVADTLFSGVKNFLFGSGLGTFNVDFSQFRPENFNYDAVAWSLRFGQPISTLLGLLAEGGLVLTLLFIFVFLFVLGHVSHIWFKMKAEGPLQNLISSFGLEMPDMRLDIFLAAIGWVILTIGMGALFYGVTLWWLWWLFLALVISGLAFVNNNIIKIKEWEVEETPQYSLSFSFMLIVIIAAAVMVGVWQIRLYAAEAAYTRALQTADTQTAEAELQTALARRGSFDSYHAALAQVYLLQAVNKGQEAQPDIQAISSLVALAVNEAKAATDLSPQSVALWENLATMYENGAALVPEARSWAIKSLIQARDLEPTNPVLSWRLGNNYSLASNWEEAIKSYDQAVNLKRDYVGAYLGLANAYEQSGKPDEAVNSYQGVLSLASDNAEVLFNFGRLLFNRNKGEDRSNAEKLWLEAARLQPNYSNALYSMGLLYENKGDRAEALRYYYKVKDLNPDNKDVTAKIRKLVE